MAYRAFCDLCGEEIKDVRQQRQIRIELVAPELGGFDFGRPEKKDHLLTCRRCGDDWYQALTDKLRHG